MSAPRRCPSCRSYRVRLHYVDPIDGTPRTRQCRECGGVIERKGVREWTVSGYDTIAPVIR